LLVNQEDNGILDTSNQPYDAKLPNGGLFNEFLLGKRPEGTYEGLSCFVGPGYTLEFCQNEALSEGKFTLIYDETPDFDGEPAEEQPPQAPYIYKITA
jgi:hypothetical protein